MALQKKKKKKKKESDGFLLSFKAFSWEIILSLTYSPTPTPITHSCPNTPTDHSIQT